MRKEEAVALSKKAIEELADALAAGKSDQLVKYLDTMSRFHRYSFGNCLLILQQYPKATKVAGFTAWKKLDRTVKKGEKGICILAPLAVVRQESDEGEEVKILGFRAVHVFDIAQTEGKDLPQISRVSGDPSESLTRLRQVVSNRGITLSYESDLGGAEGVSKGREICLLDSLTPATEFAALAHEMAHEALHKGPDRKELSKTVRELEAEATAYVVAKAIGLENALHQSADYIQLYNGDKEQLMNSLGRIGSAATQILTDMEDVESKIKEGSLSA